jgi:hypothetical protein
MKAFFDGQNPVNSALECVVDAWVSDRSQGDSTWSQPIILPKSLS